MMKMLTFKWGPLETHFSEDEMGAVRLNIIFDQVKAIELTMQGKLNRMRWSEHSLVFALIMYKHKSLCRLVQDSGILILPSESTVRRRETAFSAEQGCTRESVMEFKRFFEESWV